MKNPVLVEQLPDKGNIVLAMKNHVTLQLSFMPFVNRLKEVRSNMERVIILCKQRDHCAVLYSFFKYYCPMRRPENRLVDMFSSGTQQEVKDHIITALRTLFQI